LTAPPPPPHQCRARVAVRCVPLRRRGGGARRSRSVDTGAGVFFFLFVRRRATLADAAVERHPADELVGRGRAQRTPRGGTTLTTTRSLAVTPRFPFLSRRAGWCSLHVRDTRSPAPRLQKARADRPRPPAPAQVLILSESFWGIGQPVRWRMCHGVRSPPVDGACAHSCRAGGDAGERPRRPSAVAPGRAPPRRTLLWAAAACGRLADGPIRVGVWGLPSGGASPFPCVCFFFFFFLSWLGFPLALSPSRTHRNKHERAVHEGLRPFGCPTCGARFAFRDGLDRHARRHPRRAEPPPL